MRKDAEGSCFQFILRLVLDSYNLDDNVEGTSPKF